MTASRIDESGIASSRSNGHVALPYFTAGGWAYDYGTAQDSEEMFEYIKGYSPVQCKSGNYPATMVTTGDHDDRVVPAHSFKFAAELQENKQEMIQC
jgi:prolyl oligopeptidase PreP (S9A serine peptidase family)